MNYTTILGEITELRCKLDFVKRGIILSQPTNPSSRYDFIADVGKKIIRIQCKTCHLSTEKTIEFFTVSKNWNTGIKHKYTNDIDYFYTNWENQGYLIDVNLCNNSQRKSIRIKNRDEYINKKSSALYAEDIKIDAVLKRINPDFEYEIVDLETGLRANAKYPNRKSYFCVQCGEPTSVKNGLCWTCSRDKMYGKIKKPNRELLKSQIRTLPFTKVGELYGKTDNTIRKWCEFYGLPKKSLVIRKMSDEEWGKV